MPAEGRHSAPANETSLPACKFFAPFLLLPASPWGKLAHEHCMPSCSSKEIGRAAHCGQGALLEAC